MSEEAQGVSVLEINPYLTSKLPEIKAEICDQIIACEENLKLADVRLGQLHDYLAFERDKLETRIERLEWEPKCDHQQIEKLNSRLQDIIDIIAEFPLGSATTSIRILRSLIDQISLTLEETS
jgi:hypothetical protein